MQQFDLEWAWRLDIIRATSIMIPITARIITHTFTAIRTFTRMVGSIGAMVGTVMNSMNMNSMVIGTTGNRSARFLLPIHPGSFERKAAGVVYF